MGAEILGELQYINQNIGLVGLMLILLWFVLIIVLIEIHKP